MKKSTISLGDCFEIPLENGSYAYGQYVFWDREYGPLCRIFDVVSNQRLTLEVVRGCGWMFPPVYIGFGSVFKTGVWRIIGATTTDGFEFPLFRKNLALKPGTYTNWEIYDGKSLRSIGELPLKFRGLEGLCCWTPQGIAHRILTGKNRYDAIL